MKRDIPKKETEFRADTCQDARELYDLAVQLEKELGEANDKISDMQYAAQDAEDERSMND